LDAQADLRDSKLSQLRRSDAMDLDSSVRKVGALTSPRNVVVVGASDNPGSWPAVVWETIKLYGFPRPLYPVNPNRQTIGADRCYPDFKSLPEPPDHLVMLIPSARIPDALRAGAQAGARTATVFSSGFGETGTAEGLALEHRLLDVLAETGIAISGPNCTGNICARSRLVTLVDHRVFKVEPGPVALVGQSGGVLLYANHILADRGIQIGYALTSGNEASLTTGDYIAFLAQEPTVKVVFCYVEAIKEPEKFKAACSTAQAAGKPVIVFKLGSSEAGRQAAVTHTGALAGSTEIFDAVAGECGVIRVDTLDQAIETIELAVHARVPIGHRVGALSLSGAYRGILLDGIEGTSLTFPSLSGETEKKLANILSVGSSVGNPADGGFTVLTSVDKYIDSIDTIAQDPDMDAIVLQAELPREPGMAASWEERFQRIDELAAHRRKPVICVSMYSRSFTDYTRKVRAGLPNTAFVQETKKSLKALSYLADWSTTARAARDSAVAQTLPHAHAAGFRTTLRAKVANDGTTGPTALNEPDSKHLLQEYGISVVAERVVKSADDAVRAAEAIGFPIVLKAVSRSLLHKSDVGAVKLNIASAADLRAAYDEILQNLSQNGFPGELEGMLVSRQVKGGVELALGVHRDVDMGLVLMAGSGGILLELVRDVTFAALPITLEKAHAMIGRLKIARLLKGYRGSQPHDLDALAGAILSLGRLAADLDDVIESIDINPFISVPGAGGFAVDALVVVRRH
jgi:acetate---CoA ligase (ADP-forming)